MSVWESTAFLWPQLEAGGGGDTVRTPLHKEPTLTAGLQQPSLLVSRTNESLTAMSFQSLLNASCAFPSVQYCAF